jgi:predicted RNA-binding protein YlxR (DUF448 family)
VPERRCIATGTVGPKSSLVRFVRGPDGRIVPDIAEKLPGRGIWVAADKAALEKAVKKGLFARAAGEPVEVPATLVADVEALLLARVVERLAMARKAGRAVAGREKVKGWLLSEEAAVLMQASDGSEREKSRLRPPPGEGTFLEVLNASEMGLAFGREHVIHAALAAGGLTQKLCEDALRLSGVREMDGGKSAGKVKKTI